jgi:hypothetical protein
MVEITAETPPAYVAPAVLPAEAPVAKKVDKKEKRSGSRGCLLKKIYQSIGFIRIKKKPRCRVDRESALKNEGTDAQSVTEYGDEKSVSDEKSML